MSTFSAQRNIHADLRTIADIILNVAGLADWNPALNSIDTRDRFARAEHPYRVSARIPGRATLTYTHTTPDYIVWRLEVAGNTEIGRWELQSQGKTTRVIHTMIHTGTLFRLMDNVMSNVPAWRLDRLQQRAEHDA